MELASFRTLNVADITLLSTEVRDLGKLGLQIGGVTETVTITSEVTPVQVADSSSRGTLTQDDIAAIPTKGRDIFGMLSVLPGVQDTNLNRDFTQWRSAISVTINGMPSQNKDVRVDGITIVDEGGCGTAYVNPNMDAVGEVQVIANGYTAENGRNNGGVINLVTKSGTNQFGRPAGTTAAAKVQRERLRPRAPNQAEAALRSTSAGSASAVRSSSRACSTAGTSAQGFYFLARRNSPTTRGRRRPRAPTSRPERKYMGISRQTRMTAGTVQPIMDPLTGQHSRAAEFRPRATPGCGIPASRIDPLGQRILRLAARSERVLNPQGAQAADANSART